MALNSNIEWTNHTINLWWGCNKVAQGCKHCYAEVLSNRFHGDSLWGPGSKRKAVKHWESDLNKIAKITKQTGVLQRVFVGSMMDIFEESKPITEPSSKYDNTREIRQYFFSLIKAGIYDDLIFLLLTKRPENANTLGGEIFGHSIRGVNWPSNVWIGASAANQDEFLNNCVTMNLDNIPRRFISLEPQIAAIDWKHPHVVSELENLDWLIQGGESGPNRRPFDLQWAYDCRDACRAAGVPYFFKQVDKVRPVPDDLMIRELPNYFTHPIITAQQ